MEYIRILAWFKMPLFRRTGFQPVIGIAANFWHGSIVGVTVVLSPLEMPENKGGSATAALTDEPCRIFHVRPTTGWKPVLHLNHARTLMVNHGLKKVHNHG